MLKNCMQAALVAGIVMGASVANANEGRSVEAVMVDRTITFAIPSHAIASYVATLNEKSDFAVFVHEDCPADLQRMALRKLWKMLPQETANSAYN
jgi:hypothetical protein